MADGICRDSRQKKRKHQQILVAKFPRRERTKRRRVKGLVTRVAEVDSDSSEVLKLEINLNKDQENPRNPSTVFLNLNGENPKETGAQNKVAGNNIRCQRGFDMLDWSENMKQKIQPVKNKVSELSHMYYNGVLDDEAISVFSHDGDPQIDHGTGPTDDLFRDGACAHNSQGFSVVLECEIENVGRQDVELAIRAEKYSVPCSVIESGKDPQLTRRVLVSLLDDEDEDDRVCQEGVACKKTRKRVGRLRCRKEFGELDQYLDTHIIDRYMEQIWKDLPKSKKDHCTYLDCLWFSMYLEELTSFKILKWIKAKRIFSKRYVFIPIVHWGHWNLLILCHFGDELRSRLRTPCMLLLDSLKQTDPSRLEPLIRKFLVEVLKGEGRKNSEKIISRFPLLVPEVPQQTNGNDCGVFLLHFIDLFLQQAPDNFSTSGDCYPYFLTKDWFKLRDIRLRRKQINDVLLKEQDGTNQMVTRRISTRSKKLNGFLSSGRASNWIDLSTGA